MIIGLSKIGMMKLALAIFQGISTITIPIIGLISHSSRASDNLNDTMTSAQQKNSVTNAVGL